MIIVASDFFTDVGVLRWKLFIAVFAIWFSLSLGFCWRISNKEAKAKRHNEIVEKYSMLANDGSIVSSQHIKKFKRRTDNGWICIGENTKGDSIFVKNNNEDHEQ